MRHLIFYPEKGEMPPGADETAVSFLDYCRSVKAPGEYAPRDQFDMFLLRPWFGYLMILDYLPDGDDFSYRLYGSEIAANSGFDMTGKRVSHFDSKTGRFFRQSYIQSVKEKRLIYTINLAEHAQYELWWHRVICPVQKGTDVQIIACNYPRPVQ